MTPLAELAAYVVLLPRRQAAAEALGVTATRLSAWMARAAGKSLPARSSGNWDPTAEQVAKARELLEAHGREVDAVLSRVRRSPPDPES